MKKYLCIILACLLSIVLIGCDNNAGVSEITTSDEIDTEELTNPGENLFDHCPAITFNGTSVALPTSFEKLNELFVLEKIPSSVTYFDDCGGYNQIDYNVFTKSDNLYCGTAIIMHYDNGDTFVRRFAENERNDYSKLTGAQIYHLGDKIGTSIGSFKTLETTKKQIEEKLGNAITIDAECEYYTFEDADLILYYGNNVLIGYKVYFK